MSLRLTLTAVVVLVATSVAHGQAATPRVVVLPVGSGDGLYATTRVAWAIAGLMNKQHKGQALLTFPIDRLPPADERAKRKADRLLSKAHESFQMMEFDKVEDRALKTLDTYKELLKSNIGRDEYLETLHLMASSALADGRMDDANKHMNDAILFHPQPPEKRKFNPQVQDLYKQVKIMPRGTGVINLGCEPRSLVWFNNRLHGVAQGKFKLHAGLYLVRIYRPGYALYQRWFRVEPLQSRDLMVTLKQDDSPEPEIIESLRSEVLGGRPGTAANQVTIDHGASELVVVTADPNCTEGRCLVGMHWASAGAWVRHEQGTFTGRGAPLAFMLLEKKVDRDPSEVDETAMGSMPEGLRPCDLDTHCGFNEICRHGQCVEQPKPLIKKWWFWTAIGVAVGAAAVAIAVPLTRPGPPVIEVR